MEEQNPASKGSIPNNSQEQDALEVFESNAKKREDDLKAKMIEWKEKGNTQLADACADALDINQRQEKKEKQSLEEDEFTQKLQVEVERLEAEDEFRLRKQPNIKKPLQTSREQVTSPSLKPPAPSSSANPSISTSPSLKPPAPSSSENPSISTSPSLKPPAPSSSSRNSVSKNDKSKVNISSTKKLHTTNPISKKLKDTKFMLTIIGLISFIEFFRIIIILLNSF